MRQVHRAYGEKIAEASGQSLRHGHGSQFVCYVFYDELRFFGIQSSPAFVREPDRSGCAERFDRTLKEQFLRLRRLETVGELNAASLHEYRDRCNREWIVDQHGCKSPKAVRAAFMLRNGGSRVINSRVVSKKPDTIHNYVCYT